MRTVALATILDAAISHEYIGKMYEIESLMEKGRELRAEVEVLVGN